MEIDSRLNAALAERFGEDKKFHLISGDILQQKLGSLADDERLRVVGNLPYAITSPILFKLLAERAVIRDAVLMMQKEVAERLKSRPGCKAYGIPSVLFQLYSELELMRRVSPRVFKPVPRVESAVMRIRFRADPLIPVRDQKFLSRVIKTGFGKRRKMLRNALAPLLPADRNRTGAEIDLTRRAEELSIEEWVRLSHLLSEMQKADC